MHKRNAGGVGADDAGCPQAGGVEPLVVGLVPRRLVSLQWRCSFGSTSPVSRFVHIPPLAATTVGGPRMAESRARAEEGSLSHSTDSATPFARPSVFAPVASLKVAIGGQNTAGVGSFAALVIAAQTSSTRLVLSTCMPLVRIAGSLRLLSSRKARRARNVPSSA